MWIQILEGLHAEEAELLDLVKDKKVTSRYKITRQNVIDAFPNWVSRTRVDIMSKESLKQIIRDLKDVLYALECEVSSDESSYTLNIDYNEVLKYGDINDNDGDPD